MKFVKEILDVSMVGRRDDRYIAWSPDGVELIIMQQFEEWFLEYADEGVIKEEGISYMPAAVEIKTRIYPTSVAAAVHLATVDVICCQVGDSEFKKYVPSEHMTRLLHLILILKFI